MTKATVLPFVPKRSEDGSVYTLEILPAITLNDQDITVATQQVNHLFESQIIQQPEQYFWVHKRFKPPAASAPNPYK